MRNSLQFPPTWILSALAPWGFADDSCSTGGLRVELSCAICVHSDRLVFYFGLLNLILLLLIGNLVFCYEGFLKRLFFAVNYI